MASETATAAPVETGSLYEVVSEGYRASPIPDFAPVTGRWPTRFCIEAVYEMLKDPQVTLAAALRRAPLLSPIFTVKGPANLKTFVEEELQRFWMMAMPEAVDGMFFAVSALECIYKRAGGLVRFDRVESFNPRDVKALTDGSKLLGFKASGRYTLTGLKAFLYMHKRRHREWTGNSCLEPTFDPWMEKWDYRGAKEARKLWFYKWAFQGGIMVYPKGSQQTATGIRTNQQIARDAVERMGFGAAITLEAPGEAKNGNWEYIAPTINGEATGLTERIDSLDVDITRSLEIPDDIVRQDSGTGSYAGRSIPMMAFFITQKHLLLNFGLQVMEQVILPLVALNFGAPARDQVSLVDAEVDIDKLMPIQPAKEGQAVKTPPKKSKTTQAS